MSCQFTERGHIFVQVHLADNLDLGADEKVYSGLNGLSQSEKVQIMSDCTFDTLSGFEAADTRNNWENFKLLLSDEMFLPEASTSDKEPDIVTLIVSVEDTGIGIPLRAQDRVFTPFMQADSSTSRNYGGTGIGLSITKCLVELMGGQIDFVSRPNVGSTFTFTAVFKRCNKDAIADTKRTLSEALPTGFRGMKAFIVDGKPVRNAVTRYHLKRLGMAVEVANTVKMMLNSLTRQNSNFRTG